ncbi:unnamed protein product [Linum tenue]|nr:unnamed protein product [Linum tenue]
MSLPKLLQFNFFLSNPNSANSQHSIVPKNPFTVECRQAAVPPPFPEKWIDNSWGTKKTLQLPKYQNQVNDIEEFPPLVTPGEARSLHDRLGDAAFGKAFLLQGGGDCSEEGLKEFNGDRIRDTFSILLQMATLLMFGGQVPIIKVARMASQFENTSYKRDNFNGDESRIPDPHKMIKTYGRSAATLNLLRALATGGFASMKRITQWNLDFAEMGNRYQDLANQVDEALGFMEAAGVPKEHPVMARAEFWTSHECSLLPYEQSLTRFDLATGLYYDCSAHMLWCGEGATRQLDGAQVEFLRGISNPLGIKVSDKMDSRELVKLIDILNPANLPGRITIIISRMGSEKLRVKLPELIRAVHGSKQIVTWICDPMNGSIKAPCGLNSTTRPFDRVLAEVGAFFDVHDQEGSHPGGIHLEMTGAQHVTEWIGGSCMVTSDDLSSGYRAHCNPRLNASQSLELAFIVAERLKHRRF